jgi:hypothetical protein
MSDMRTLYRRYAFGAVLLLATVPEAHAEFWNGTTLMQYLEEDMRGSASYTVGLAGGYIMGVTDTVGGALACLPPTTTMKQVTQVVFNYMKANPRTWNNSADAVIIAALKDSWPCQKQ